MQASGLMGSNPTSAQMSRRGALSARLFSGKQRVPHQPGGQESLGFLAQSAVEKPRGTRGGRPVSLYFVHQCLSAEKGDSAWISL